ncbi:MAG: TIGR03936 family radical SAM-associated protein [Halanaerobiaceae bacterium]
MMVYRTRFIRGKEARYISHLELMTAFRRTFRRARLPVTYSQGFNPHINLSMGQPLPVGMTGEGYFDLELADEVTLDEYVGALGSYLPPGIEVREARQISADVKSLQAVVNTAVYLLGMKFTSPPESEEDLIRDFMGCTEIEITRHRRNKDDRKLDLRPMIYGAAVVTPGIWKFTVSTGSQGNVRSGEITDALAARYDEIEKIPVVNVHREGLYVKINKSLFAPFANEVVGR